jgi:arylamine N-acetyltransferase
MAQKPAGWPDAEHRALNVRMNQKGIEYYVEKTAQAQAALAPLQEYVPADHRRLELKEADEPALMAAALLGRPEFDGKAGGAR